MHKLTKTEELNLDKYWDFIETFKLDYDPNKNPNRWIEGVWRYRLQLIPKIRKMYTANDFYKYEKILNKLLWNLLEKIKFKINSDYFDLREKNHKKSIGSYQHKTFIDDDKSKIYYVFYYYILFSHLNYDKITKEKVAKIFHILSDRQLYEKFMNNIIIIDDINPKQYYYPHDYPFPNINLLFYNKNKKDIWINRINQLYFRTSDNKKINKGWYKPMLNT